LTPPKHTQAMRRLILLGLLILLLAPAAWAKTYDHPLIEQTFQLLPDGDAVVDDVRTFRFEGPFSWAELRLRVTGQYGRYDVQYLGVWDADTRQPLRMERSSQGDDRILRWYYQAEDTTRRFLLRYRIVGAVQRYGDVAQFYWKAIEDEHAPIRQVQIAVVPPGPSPAQFKVFVHSRAAPGDLAFANDYSRAVITQSGIPETSFVEVRAFLDPSLFLQAPVRTGQDLESLLADERNQSNGGNWFQWLLSLGFIAAGVLIVALVVGFVWVYLRYGKEWGVLYDVIYERDPPRPLPPAVVPAILTQGRVQNAELAKGFAATLLEAARLGYLEIQEVQDAGLLSTGLFKDTDLVYRLTKEGRALLDQHLSPHPTLSPTGRGKSGWLLPEPPPGGGRPDRKPNERELEPFEVEVLEAVFRRAGSGDTVTSDQVKSWGKKIVSSKSNFLRFVEAWGPRLRSWFERNFFPLDDPKSEQARIAFTVFAVIVMVVAFFIGFGGSLFVAGPVGAVLVAVAWKSLARRTPQAALEVKRWEAFRRFMTDFSAMKDAGPQLLPLWEHYLVYAMALGVADRLLQNLKLVAAELKQTVPSARWYSGPGGRGGPGMSLASLESLTRSFENFQNLSRALSSSTGTGGGFSGGGGGGGGGGGSRAG